MASTLMEHASSRVLSEAMIKEISQKVADKLATTRQFYFANILYQLISKQCAKNITSHIQSQLPKIGLSRVDAILVRENEQEAINAIVGEIVIKNSKVDAIATANSAEDESASDDEKESASSKKGPSAVAVMSGTAVTASGLCQVYFSALSARVAQFGWDAVGQVVPLPNFSQWPTLFNRTQQDSLEVATTTSMIASPRANKSRAQRAQERFENPESGPTEVPACMHDELEGKHLQVKMIALAIQRALLRLYSAQQLLEAIIDLHNNKDPFTVLLRKNSNFFSAIVGKDTHSWKEAVEQIKAEAQRRLDSVSQSSQSAIGMTLSTAIRDEKILQAVTCYQSSLFNDSNDVATKGLM